ncbi:MAG: hypothetical protein Kilf2KO_44140 [Rhodospirillales bacterium]
MDLAAFAARHLPALEADEARHNVMIAVLLKALAERDPALRVWSLGAPGVCALQSGTWPVVLGNLDRAAGRDLASALKGEACSGTVGPDSTALWVAEDLCAQGLRLVETVAQQIYRIDCPPRGPEIAGRARPAEARDAGLIADWMLAFHREATPHNELPERETLEAPAYWSRHWLWEVAGQAVSTAGSHRRTRNCLVVTGVYTPPDRRGRGYAGAATAALVRSALEAGTPAACLYTDLANPAANRCYQGLGFRPWCPSHHCILTGEVSAVGRYSKSRVGGLANDDDLR